MGRAEFRSPSQLPRDSLHRDAALRRALGCRAAFACEKKEGAEAAFRASFEARLRRAIQTTSPVEWETPLPEQVAPTPPHRLPIKVWTTDESRFGLRTARRRRLTLRGVKPLLQCRHEFDNIYLYGAVAPLAGESVFLELPYLDTEHFQIFLDYFASRYPESLNLMVLDNGGYHTTPRLRRPEHIRFVFTPPYTPEVSPMERVFEDVKDKVTADVHQSLDELSEGLCAVIQSYTPERLSSLTGYRFFHEGAQAVSVGQ